MIKTFFLVNAITVSNNLMKEVISEDYHFKRQSLYGYKATETNARVYSRNLLAIKPTSTKSENVFSIYS